MFENPRRGRQARNFTTNVPKILDLKSSSEQIFEVGCPCPVKDNIHYLRYIFTFQCFTSSFFVRFLAFFFLPYHDCEASRTNVVVYVYRKDLISFLLSSAFSRNSEVKILISLAKETEKQLVFNKSMLVLWDFNWMIACSESLGNVMTEKFHKNMRIL